MALNFDGSDGAPVALHDLGGRGRTALFVHATGFHGHVWAPVAALLGDRLAAWAVDLRGHGDSPAATRPTEWAGFGRDVVTATRRLGRPLLGVGHSLGAAALLMAELAEPGTFDELVLYEPALPTPGGVDAEAQAVLVARTRNRRATFASRDEAKANFAAKPPTSALAADVLRQYVEHGFVEDAGTGTLTIKCAPDREAAIYAAAGGSALWAQLRPLTCRVTLVGGTGSGELHERSNAHAAERLGVPVTTLAGIGHFGPMESPRVFADLVRRLLDG